jgi:hypothetical protein
VEWRDRASCLIPRNRLVILRAGPGLGTLLEIFLVSVIWSNLPSANKKATFKIAVPRRKIGT